MPIEHLMSAGAAKRAIATLRNAGFSTVADVVARSSSLSSLRGIGSVGAQSVRTAARAIQASLTSDYRVRIERPGASSALSGLLDSVMRYRALLRLDAKVFTNAEETRSRLRRLVSSTELADHPWRHLFASAESKGTLEAELVKLQAYLGAADVHRLRADAKMLKAGFSSDNAVNWRFLDEHSSEVHSVLARALSTDASTAVDFGNLQLDDGGEGSPLAQLVEHISAYELNDRTDLRVVLRPYQAVGAKFALLQRRVILGDEMGLGKTIEALAVICHLHAAGATHFLVAAPLSLTSQWSREVALKSTLAIHRPRGSKAAATMLEWGRRGGVAICSIDTIKSMPTSSLNGARLATLIVDEAQLVKNPRTQRSIGIQPWIEEAQRTLFLTGHPLENRVDDFLALERLLRPGVESLMPEAARYSPRSFRAAVAPIYLRRNQADVLNELPPIIAADEWIELSAGERKTYLGTTLRRDLHALRLAAFGQGDEPAKLARILEIVDDARANNRKVAIFSFYRDVLKTVADAVGQRSRVFGPFDGKVSVDRRDALVMGFTEHDGHAVFVAQIITGGQGLNLQTANIAILCEPQLKPSSEEQAIARLQRMGQTNRVQVHRLIAQGTVDERLLSILARKQRLFEQYAGQSDLADEVKRMISMNERQIAEEIIEGELAEASARTQSVQAS